MGPNAHAAAPPWDLRPEEPARAAGCVAAPTSVS